MQISLLHLAHSFLSGDHSQFPFLKLFQCYCILVISPLKLKTTFQLSSLPENYSQIYICFTHTALLSNDFSKYFSIKSRKLPTLFLVYFFRLVLEYISLCTSMLIRKTAVSISQIATLLNFKLQLLITLPNIKCLG